MPLNYPGFAGVQPYAQTPDIAGDFFRSLKAGTDVRNEADAADALAAYARSLYAGKPPAALMDLAPQAPTAPQVNGNGAQNLGDLSTLASPAERAADIGPDYYARIAQSESGGNPNATNPSSSAKGPYQILDGTAADIQQRHPDLGLTGDWRTDPAQSLKGYQALTGDNAKVLSRAGVPVNPGNLYLGAYFGGQGAVDLLKLPDSTPMSVAVSPDVVKANPTLANQTVGDVKAWAASKAGNGRGGYQAPSQGVAPPAADTAGLPPRDVMVALLRNPETRAFAGQLITAQRSGTGLTDDQKEYAQAVAQGFRGTIIDYQQALKAGANGGLTEVSPNATLYDPKTNQAVFTAPAAAGATSTADPNNLPIVQLDQSGAPEPTQQQAFLDQLGDPGTAALLKQITDYRAPIEKVTSLRGGERQRLAALAAQLDPTFDMTQYSARAKARQAYTTGQQGQTITSANTVIGHLSNLADDADKLGNGDFTPFNVAGNTWKGLTSNPDLAKFNSDKMAVASELAKFFKGTGSTDLTTTEEWQSVFDQNTGPGALKAVVGNVIGNLMKSRLDEMRSQFSSVMGKPSDFRFITPETDGVLKKLGIDTSAIDPSFGGAQPGGDKSLPTPQSQGDFDQLKSGDHYISPDDGQEYVKP